MKITSIDIELNIFFINIVFKTYKKKLPERGEPITKTCQEINTKIFS